MVRQNVSPEKVEVEYVEQLHIVQRTIAVVWNVTRIAIAGADEKAFEQMQEEEKALQKTGKNSEITKGYCEMFNHLLDDILGEGVSEKLFGGKYNTLTTDRVYGEFLEICSTQVKSNNAERTKIVSKYRPNRAQRRAKK